MQLKKSQNQNSVIQAMNTLFTVSKDSQLNDTHFEEVEKEISLVKKFLNSNALHAILFSNIAILKLTGKSSDMAELSSHLGMSSIEFLPYKEDLDGMIKQGLLFRKHNRRFCDDFTKSKSYSIDDSLLHAIIHDLPLPACKEKKVNGTLDVLEQINELIKMSTNDELENYEFFLEVKSLLDENSALPIIQHLKSLELEENYLILLCHLYWKYLSGNVHEGVEDIIELVCISGADRVKMTQAILSGNDPLAKLDYTELKEGRFMNDLEVHLTDSAAEVLLLENITIKSSSNKKQKTITPADIYEKKLFFNEAEATNLDRIQEVLLESNYQSIISRLKDNKMVHGLNILFYGSPGTGKTESVLQIAKATGREIMKVEISQTKSMWFGESEKIVKRIFRNYEALHKQSKQTPILFFNEADAILGKRKNSDAGNTAQTENAIQNILLEELENFKGIFMATTNLTNNLDKAFDRRFLFKVEFQRPSVEVAASIWKDKLPHLSKKECTFLAEEFEFSGGQIDNIVRKSEIEFVLNNKKADLDGIVAYCLDEELDKSNSFHQRIGF